jgi:hypothetical protein
VTAEEIAKDAEYQGTRVLLSGRMDNVRLRIQIDFGVGDAISPGPRWIDYPTFLDQPPLRLLAYPVEAAIAEKFQAMVALDLANSRMKDFFDVWSCSRNLDFDGEALAGAMTATFTPSDRHRFRLSPLPRSQRRSTMRTRIRSNGAPSSGRSANRSWRIGSTASWATSPVFSCR